MLDNRLPILIVGPEEEPLLPILTALERRGYAPVRVPDLHSALNLLVTTSVGATLVYYSPTRPEAFDIIQMLRQTYPNLPHLVLVQPEDEPAVRASGRVSPDGVALAQPDDEGQWVAPLETALAARERARRRARLRGSIP